MSDALSRIRQILSESGTDSSRNATGLSEDNMTDGLKGHKYETILSGPGTAESDAAAKAGSGATPPHKDPKGKSSTPNNAIKSPDTKTATNEEDETLEDADAIEEAKDEDEEEKSPNPFAKFAKKKKKDSDDEEDEKDESEDDEDEKKGKKPSFPFFAKKKGEMKEEVEQNAFINTLFENEELTEEFKDRASALFEAAMVETEQQLIEAYDEAFDNALVESYDNLREEMAEALDRYLTATTSEWMEKNGLEVESGIRTEVAESFISGLVELFRSHNVNVPEEGVDIVRALDQRVAELEEELNTLTNEKMELSEVVIDLHKKDLIESAGAGMTDVAFDRFAKLCESIEYNDDDTFVQKLKTIKESSGSVDKTRLKGAIRTLTEDTVDITESNENEATRSDNAEVSSVLASLRRMKN